jgi:hypothetical protein
MLRLLNIITWMIVLGCSKPTPVTPITPTPPVPVVTRVVNVSNANELKTALLNARAGDDIIMADGIYNGKFVVAAGVNGTATSPITLRGSRNAVLDAGSISTGYVFYLQANYWTLRGFSITNGLKGLMTDGANHNTIDGLKVSNIGEEAIHLRTNSVANIISNCDISITGLKTPDYGEGIYLGSAKNNWATYTNGNPDYSDSNQVINNHIGPNVTAECIDVKEGTTAGIIKGNTFDATGITGANSGDSWIDVKGNKYKIESNIGLNPGGSIFKDGYQVHCAVDGWGNNNEFRNNTCTVNATGYGFNIQLSGSNGNTVGNKVYSNNTVTGAGSGIANIALSN